MTTRSRSPHNSLFAVVYGALVLLVVAAIMVFRGPVFSFVSAVPAWVTASPSDTYAAIPHAVLAARLADAEGELARIRYQAVLYTALADEFDHLSEVRHIPTEQKVAVARVLARPPQTHYDTLLVSLPDGHSVAVGDRAFVDTLLLGEVTEVAPHAARITLTSSGGSTSDARVGDPSGIVVMKGEGGGAFTFELPHTVSVAPGDAVREAQNSAHVLAVVRAVRTDPDTTTVTVYAALPIPFADIRYVTITRGSHAELP